MKRVFIFVMVIVFGGWILSELFKSDEPKDAALYVEPVKSVIIRVYKVDGGDGGDGEFVVEYDSGHAEIVYPDGHREPLIIVTDEAQAQEILKKIKE